MIQIPELLLTLLAIPFLIYSSHFLLSFALILGGSILVWSGYRETQGRFNCFNPELSEKCQNNRSLKYAILSEFKSPQLYINSFLLSAPIIITIEKNNAFYIASVMFLVIKSFIEAIIHTFGLFFELKNERRRRSGTPPRVSLVSRLYEGIKKLIIGEVIQDVEIIRKSDDDLKEGEYCRNESGNENGRDERERRENSATCCTEDTCANDADNSPREDSFGRKRDCRLNESQNGRTDLSSVTDSDIKANKQYRLNDYDKEYNNKNGDEKNDSFKYQRQYDKNNKHYKDSGVNGTVQGYKTFLHQFFSVVIFVTGMIIVLAGIIRLFPDP